MRQHGSLDTRTLYENLSTGRKVVRTLKAKLRSASAHGERPERATTIKLALVLTPGRAIK